MLPDIKNIKPSAHQETEKSVHSDPSCQGDEAEAFWENGIVSASDNWNGMSSNADNLTVEFIEHLTPAQRKCYRRASAEEKELAELVHKVHLLCLLGRGILVDGACNDSLIQASLLPLLPRELLKITEIPKLTTNTLFPLVKWFHNTFCVQYSSIKEGFFKSNLEFALGSQKGSSEEVVALFVALLRALNLRVRFVSVLTAASLKPDSDISKTPSRSEINLDTKALPSTKSSISPYAVSTSHPSPSSSANTSILKKKSTQSKMSAVNKRYVCSSAKCSTDEVRRSSTSEIRGDNQEHVNSVSCSERSKRKGDVEFEMQLEVALAATAVHDDKVCSDSKGLHKTLDQVSPSKKMKSQNKEVSSSTPEKVDAVWSRKMGPPLYWSEVYCSGENLTGRWVHVDVINAIIDGELKVEAAAAVCRRPLRYVVAFSGNGAKDVTRRYCAQWYKIAPYRIQSGWWDSVLEPLKVKVDMENSFSDDPTLSGVLEDMELETRALTEPLPTNQQAYRNHHLYVIERWITKYQILHPKGPILGYCSGHPVYPRACVKTLHSKNKWLREGLQVKANEAPAKIIMRSSKLSDLQPNETNNVSISLEDDTNKIELFGSWQTEPLCLPQAVNGIVPKNEWGRVDAWSEKCLPPGTVHLRFPRLVPVAKRLGIDFAPAMVGFEFRNGRSLPVFEGIVICSEFRNVIMEAYFEEEVRREAEEKKQRETQALRRWFQLMSSMITRQKLSNSYESHPSSRGKTILSSAGTVTDMAKDDSCMGVGMLPTSSLQDTSAPSNRLISSDLHGNHEHTFPLEQQIFDQETYVKTKRCPCGFSIQVEEL